MGRPASACAGALIRLGAALAPLSWALPSFGQVPLPAEPARPAGNPGGAAPEPLLAPAPPPPAPEPVLAPSPEPPLQPPAPSPQLAAAPPPLYPPPQQEAEPVARPLSKRLPRDFALGTSPWVDLTLTSFWMDNRASNFLNLGVQSGAYLFGHVRVSARLVAPLGDVSREYHGRGGSVPVGGSLRDDPPRKVSVLYGFSVGAALATSPTFVFGPSFMLLRSDVNDYGTGVGVVLPFEWTTPRKLRIAFEIGLGQGVGGSVRQRCTLATTPVTSCGTLRQDRPSGTLFVLQYNMGWALGPL